MKKTMLIISVQGLGNTVMLVPVLKVLCKDPELELHFVLSNNGSARFIKAMRLDNIKEIYIWDESKRSIGNILSLVKKLRLENFETAYAAYLSCKRENLLLFLSKSGSKKSLKLPMGHLKLLGFLNKGARAIESSHDLVNNSKLFDVKIDIPKKRSKLGSVDQIIIGVHIGSKGVGKRWDILKYCGLMQDLNKEFNVKFIVVAGKEESDLIQTIKDNTNLNVEFLLGVDFETVINKIGSAHLVFGNDSSICHISAVLGVPTIVLWSFANPFRVHPFGEGNMVIRMDYDCSPCFEIGSARYIDDCDYNLRCIKDIGEEKVLQILKIYLQSLYAGDIPSSDSFKALSILSRLDSFEDGCMMFSLKTS